MYTLIRTQVFEDWLSSLRDEHAKIRILERLRSASHGHFGDCAPVGEGVSEMRVHAGSGYRMYYMRTELAVYLLLTGGDKSSQKRDIKQAIHMAREIRRSKQ